MSVPAIRFALLPLLVAVWAPALAQKTSSIEPDTPAPLRYVVRGHEILDRARGYAPVRFRGLGYSPHLRGETAVRDPGPADDGRYEEHLAVVRQLNANYLHVFAPHLPPSFFRALDKTDLAYGQDIWIRPRTADLLAEDYQATALAGIRGVVDHAYSVGRPDRLVLFSIGDELSPDTIADTDRLHPEVRDYRGKHLAVSGRTPTEVALARLIDGAMDYELSRYGRRHLYCHTSFTHVGPLVRPDLEVPAASALLPDLGDLVCLNVYTYARGVVSSPPGSSTGTAYQGYLEGLTAMTDKPIFVTQVGLSTSPYEPKPWVPGFGGHRVEDVPKTFRSVWQDIRTAKGGERIVGLAFFELHDEWWKSGETWDDPDAHAEEDPEEWFGIYALEDGVRLVPKGKIPETVKELYGRPW